MSKNKEEVNNTPPSKVDLNPNNEEPLSPKEEKTIAKERARPKEYSIDTFHKELTKDEKTEFNKLDDDEQKKFIIRRWILENRSADKADQHEVSLEDERLVGMSNPAA